jgi:hypothetical protein
MGRIHGHGQHVDAYVDGHAGGTGYPAGGMGWEYGL